MRDYPLKDILIPMNASSMKDKEKLESLWDNPFYIAEEKLDGVRALSIGGRFFGRKVAKDGLPVENTDKIPHISSYLKEYPNLILDGELYYRGQKSDEVNSILNSKQPERAIALQVERGLLKFSVFDILRDIDGTWLIDLPYSERRIRLKYVLGVLGLLYTGHIELTQVSGMDKRAFYQEIVANGGEGIIFKDIREKYYVGKRPSNVWVKVKKSTTDDVVIMGYELASKKYTGKNIDTWEFWVSANDSPIMKGYGDTAESLLKGGFTPVTKPYYYGWIGAIRYGKYDSEGNLIYVGRCSGIKDEIKEMLSSPSGNDLIGYVIEIGAMEETKDEHYRHPFFIRFRPDKNAEDCKIGENN